MGDYNDALMRNQNNAVRGTTKAPRANVLQLKLIGQSHPTGLTTNLLKLFEPRPPLEYKPPLEKRKCLPFNGMARFVSHFAEPGDPEYASPMQKPETPAQRRARIHILKLERGAKKAAEELQRYKPNEDPNISGDPYKTLFVGRLNYETTESKVKREFESYGPIRRVRLVTDQMTSKPKGYAFVEYTHTRDMKSAYKQADGRKIDGRRVLVDVQRGRTVPNWRPRRLGGGLGTTRAGGEDVSQRELLQSGGASLSEEPRTREDQHSERDREKYHERGRDREKERDREKSHERSHDKPRDRDHRGDRHQRERERGRDRDPDREWGRERDREHGRDHNRDRERERGRDRDRDHVRDRPRERDYEFGDNDCRHSRDREPDYESKHDRDQHGERVYGHAEADDDHGWYEQPEQGHTRSDTEHDQHYEHYAYRSHGQYDQGEHDRYYQNADQDYDRYDHMEEDDHRYGHGTSESRDRDRNYHH